MYTSLVGLTGACVLASVPFDIFFGDFNKISVEHVAKRFLNSNLLVGPNPKKSTKEGGQQSCGGYDCIFDDYKAAGNS
jgi:hypothetical protein